MIVLGYGRLELKKRRCWELSLYRWYWEPWGKGKISCLVLSSEELQIFLLVREEKGVYMERNQNLSCHRSPREERGTVPIWFIKMEIIDDLVLVISVCLSTSVFALFFPALCFRKLPSIVYITQASLLFGFMLFSASTDTIDRRLDSGRKKRLGYLFPFLFPTWLQLGKNCIPLPVAAGYLFHRHSFFWFR